MIYDAVDVDFSINGDFIIGPDGDLKDTQFDLLKSIKNEVQSVIRSEPGDWSLQREIGSALKDFVGEPNTRETAERMKERLITSLTFNNLIKEKDLSVRIVPVHMHQVLVIIRIQAAPTPSNGIKVGEYINISFMYDTIQDDIMFMPPNSIERNAR